MRSSRALGLDGISIEIWINLGDSGLYWLIKVFNKIIMNKKNVEKVEEKHCNTHLYYKSQLILNSKLSPAI